MRFLGFAVKYFGCFTSAKDLDSVCFALLSSTATSQAIATSAYPVRLNRSEFTWIAVKLSDTGPDMHFASVETSLGALD